MIADLDFLSSHPFVRSTARDKVFGTIFGSALGDAIGLYTEFLPQHEAERSYPLRKFSLISPVTPVRSDSHRSKFYTKNAWTDDTDHALLIILSYLHNEGKISPRDFAARLQIWIEQGLRCLDRPPMGIGQLVGGVVKDPAFLESPEDVARKRWIKSGRHVAPNGSLMRTHPLGIMCVGFDLEKTFRIAADMSVVTHADPRCVVACCISTALIRGILRGEIVVEADVDAILQQAYDWVKAQPELLDPGQDAELTPREVAGLLDLKEFERHVHAKSWDDLKLDSAQQIGYVYKCLGCAILALRLGMRQTASHFPTSPDVFEDLITDLIMCGGDADTNACVTGAILGCWVGYSCLPPTWSNGLTHGEWLGKKTGRLCRMVGVACGSVEAVKEIDADTAPDGGKGLLSKEELDRRERDIILMILTRDKERKEEEEGEKQKAQGKGFGRWLKGISGSSSVN
ncbi:ADP-ribosylglycohydrolase [Glonium stellatum]|uniref:ADP-ribosylglycohydrolase n=1 Tax=Glonium stellatum TaxID=574774 RepID=A0A8E2EQ12_9PEZI|nr:ADP-ribosylglycohydrolase [Glonium stellatum]